MHLIKYGHACVRVEGDGRALMVDPGTWTDPSCLDGAEAVLVTHEHEVHHLPVADGDSVKVG